VLSPDGNGAADTAGIIVKFVSRTQEVQGRERLWCACLNGQRKRFSKYGGEWGLHVCLATCLLVISLFWLENWIFSLFRAAVCSFGVNVGSYWRLEVIVATGMGMGMGMQGGWGRKV
jgi:hypothetical protein